MNNWDIGTEVASKGAKWAGAGALGTKGALAGFALGGPLGAAVGGIGGGLAGYFGADKLIEGGRALAGTETRDPSERSYGMVSKMFGDPDPNAPAVSTTPAANGSKVQNAGQNVESDPAALAERQRLVALGHAVAKARAEAKQSAPAQVPVGGAAGPAQAQAKADDLAVSTSYRQSSPAEIADGFPSQVRVISNPRGMRAAQGLSVPEHIPAEHGVVGNGGSRSRRGGLFAGVGEGLAALADTRLAQWAGNKQFELDKYKMTHALDRMRVQHEMGKDGSATLEKALDSNIHSMVPNKDGTGSVMDPGKRAELQRFVQNSNINVQTSQGIMPLHQAMAFEPASAQQALARAGSEHGLGQLARQYGGEGMFKASPKSGDLNIEDVRPISIDDVTQGGLHLTDWAKSFAPGSYGNGVVISGPNGTKSVVPMSVLRAHPDWAEMMGVINEGLARNKRKPIDKNGKQTK